MSDAAPNPERERAQRWLAIALVAAVAAALATALAAYPLTVLSHYGLNAAVLAHLVAWLPDLAARPAAWFGGDGFYVRLIAEAMHGPPPLVLLPALPAGVAAGLALWRLSGPHSFAPSSHGAARFATARDLRRHRLFARSGFVLGRWGHARRGRLIRNPETLSVQIISPPGSGKTVHLISHMLADHPDTAPIPAPSMIVNDPKGEIFRATAGWRSTLGPVFYIRWTNLEGTAWNPLSVRNLPGGEQAVARRAALVAELSHGYKDPDDALNRILARLRDHNATWRTTLQQTPGVVGTLTSDFRFEPALLDRIIELATIDAAREQYIDRLATVAVPENVGQHWMVSGRAALAGFLLYEMVRSEREGREPSFGAMLDWLSAAADPTAADNAEEAFDGDLTAALLDDAIAEAYQYGYPSRTANELGALRIKPDKERGSVISTAIGKLNIFRNVAIRARTSRSDLTFSDLRGRDGRPVTVYFDIPVADAETLGVVTGMFLEGAAAYLISQPEPEARTRPVQFLLDEFWTLPKLAALTQIPALGRGQWVQLVVIGQSNAQVANKLGRDAVEILKAALPWKLYFSLNDLATAEEVSKMIGNRTIEQRNRSHTRGIGSSIGDGFRTNVQHSLQGMPLIRAEALLSLDKLEPEQRRWGELVVLLQGMLNTPVGGPAQPCHPVVWFADRRLRRRAHLSRPGFVTGAYDVASQSWDAPPAVVPPPQPTLSEFRSRQHAAP